METGLLIFLLSFLSVFPALYQKPSVTDQQQQVLVPVESEIGIIKQNPPGIQTIVYGCFSVGFRDRLNADLER